MATPKMRPTTDIPDRIYLASEEYKVKLHEPPSKERDDLIHRRHDLRPDPAILTGVFFRTPLTKVLDGMMNVQGHPLCGPMEMRMINCLEANGLPNGYTRCRWHMEDFYECLTLEKRFDRMKTMRNERNRQHKKGEREVKYAVPPVAGSFHF